MRKSETLVREHIQTVEVLTRPEGAGSLLSVADSGLPAPDPFLVRLIEQVEEVVREVQRREEEAKEREVRQRREEPTHAVNPQSAIRNPQSDRPTPRRERARYNVD